MIARLGDPFLIVRFFFCLLVLGQAFYRQQSEQARQDAEQAILDRQIYR